MEWGRARGGVRLEPLVPAPGTAGVMISLSRILTKLLLPDERASTLIFFLVSVGLELLCFLLHLLVRRSRFVLYYTTRPRDSRGCRVGYRVHHDVVAGDIHFVSAHSGYGWSVPAACPGQVPPAHVLAEFLPWAPPWPHGLRLRPSPLCGAWGSLQLLYPAKWGAHGPVLCDTPSRWDRLPAGQQGSALPWVPVQGQEEDPGGGPTPESPQRRAPEPARKS